MAEAAKEADTWVKQDVLIFDGPKFKFVFGEISKYVKKAAQEARGGNETTVNSILRHFRDIVAVIEAELRRKPEKIASQKVH